MAGGIVDVATGQLHCEARGDGPAVLFIHAGVADSRMWDQQWGLDGFRLIRYDMRGFGRSPVGSEQFTDHDDAVAVLDAFDVERAVLVGCSIGARAALQVAAHASGRVAGLVLVGANAPGIDAGVDQLPEWPDAVKAFEAGDLQRAAELEAEIWLAGRDRSTTMMDRDLVDLFVDMDRIALGNEEQRDELDTAEPLDELPEVDAPVRTMVGDRDLPAFLTAAALLAQQLSDQPARIIPDTAHLPSMDRPDTFNALLDDFLTSI